MENQKLEANNGQRQPALSPATCSAYWPIWKHMADNHGLTLLDSECEDILQVADQMLMRRMDATVKRIRQNMRLIDTRLRIMTETLQRIATSGRNSTRDRRNARATLRFLDSLMTHTPNVCMSEGADKR